MPARPSLLPDYEDCIGVFQGGGCRTAAYAGAYSAAVERGVNFTEVAGTSAGAIAAALIAAGATPGELEEMLTSLDFKDFLKRPHGFMASRAKGRLGQGLNLIRFNGIHSSKAIGDWVEVHLSKLLDSKHAKVRFSDLPRPISLLAANLTTHQPIVWSNEDTPDASVADAVRASCTIPFFFQPYNNMVDGGVLSNLPLHLVNGDASDRRRVLAFSLVDSDPSAPPRDAIATGIALASTVTEGSKEVQRSLNTTVDVISIHCEGVKATDFRLMSKEKVRGLVSAGRHAVDAFFGAGVTAINPVKPPPLSTHLAQTFAVAAHNILYSQDFVAFSLAIGQANGHVNWFFDLYTAVLLGRMRGVEVRVVLEHPSGAIDAHEQIATLEALGCSVKILDRGERLPVQAIVCDPGTLDATAVIVSHPGMEIHARMLSAKDGDSATIDLLAETLLRHTSDPTAGPPITLRGAPPEAVISALKAVREYSPGGVSITVERVPLDQIDSWARYALMSKQRQQAAMLLALRANGIEEFDPYYVDYGNGQGSLALPVVVERSPNGRCTVVNGLSRLLLLKRDGYETALCAVVSGVTADPPARGVLPLSYLGVRVGVRERNQTAHRYPGFMYENVRSVEGKAHALRELPPVEEG